MQDKLLLTDLEIAINAVKLASKLLIKNQDSDIEIKSSFEKDIKLQADEDSEKLIVAYLSQHSAYDILSEESGVVKNTIDQPYCWIIDPLDGSLNYSRSIDLYCISLGLWYNNEPVLGVIYDFFHERLYTGVIGEGAFCNGKPIKVSNITEKKDSIIATGFPVYTDFNSDALLQFVSTIQAYKKVRLLGSAALSLSLVAKGSIEAYTEDNIAIWDVAAGLAIVKAAGGEVKFKQGSSERYLKVYAANKFN